MPTPHIVFAWEIGSGFGHLIPMTALGGELRRQGHRVTAVVPELAGARNELSSHGIDAVEVPSRPAPERPFPISVNYTANLLRNGFWHGPTVRCRLEAWRGLLEQTAPDLLVCDHAPTALLASRDARCPRAAIGTGFTLPPLRTPMAGVQPWFPIPDDRLARADAEFLDTVNPVLRDVGLEPLAAARDLFDGVDRLLCVEPELDHYPVRPHETYFGTIEPPSMQLRAEPHWEGSEGVFVYLSATNRFLRPVLTALRDRRVPVLAYVAGLDVTDDEPPVAARTIRYLRRPVDLKLLVGRCRLAVTHGGTQTASIFLRQGTRLLMCPQDLEKAVLAGRLRERGLAHSFNWFAPDPDVEQVAATIGAILESDEDPPGLGIFAAGDRRRSAADRVTAIVDRLEGALSR